MILDNVAKPQLRGRPRQSSIANLVIGVHGDNEGLRPNVAVEDTADIAV